MNRRNLLASGVALAALALPREGEGSGRRMLELRLRKRVRRPDDRFEVRTETAAWRPDQSAVVVCDMWDAHWCKGATSRVIEVAPRMNAFLKACRDKGLLIIHSPSSCMAAYADHPARRRAQEAPKAADLPAQIGEWCRQIPAEEKGTYPIDQADGGCDCVPTCPGGNPWRRQIAALDIREEDAISDSGSEIWNLLAARGTTNVMVLGVHTNMCVLGRPFGLRNLSRYGKNAVLVRDLTDTMYNSRSWPYVNHFRGTDLIVEHIEKFVCPTISSDQILGGRAFRFAADPLARIK